MKLLVFLLIPASVFAQDLEQHIKPGDTVYITDLSGHEVAGKLTFLSDETLRILAKGIERDVPRRDVGRVQKPDSIWDGAAIGAGILGFAFAGGAGASCSPHCAGAGILSGLAGAAVGAYAGAMIDKAIVRRQLLYESPDFVVTRRSTSTSPRKHPVFISGKLGGYGSYSDPTDGTALGGAVSADVFVTKRWAVDVDVWIPRRSSARLFLPSSLLTPARSSGGTTTYGAVEPGEFRDTIAGVAAMRSFGGTGVHPYVLVGVAQAWTSARTATETWTETSKGGLQAGAGLVIPAAGHLDFVPEFRIIAGPGYFVARPTVGIRYRMH